MSVVVFPGPTRTFWVPPAYGHVAIGAGGYDSIANGSTGSVSFALPDDMSELVAADWFIYDSGGGASATTNIDLDSEYGNPDLNENVNSATETDAASTYDFSGGGNSHRISAMTVLTGVAAGDMVNVRLTNNSGVTIAQSGMRIKYR